MVRMLVMSSGQCFIYPNTEFLAVLISAGARVVLRRLESLEVGTRANDPARWPIAENFVEGQEVVSCEFHPESMPRIKPSVEHDVVLFALWGRRRRCRGEIVGRARR